MTNLAMVIRLIAVIAAIVGIVNFTGIPDNPDRMFGIFSLGAAIGAWVLANKIMQASYNSVRGKYEKGEELTDDETELLMSKE